MNVFDLPIPTKEASAHCDHLKQHIIQLIIQRGPITFAEYMQLALYMPSLGYYSSGIQKFGPNGDYTTAPEQSPLFARCLANQCEQILENIPNASILELGAGSGIMAAELLTTLANKHQLPERYYILELSAELQKRQYQQLKQRVPGLIKQVTWLNTLPKTPLNGIILANEVIDAMPVHLFKIKNGIQEIFVDQKKETLCWKTDTPSTATIVRAIEHLNIHFEEGYESEINLYLPSWIQGLSDSLNTGIMLFIDYGFPRHEYYHPDRHQGTVMCHYQHHSHAHPLILPGIQDITSHVDFTAVAEAAKNAKLQVAGFTHQAAFLMNCGLVNMLPATHDVLSYYPIAQVIKLLTLPSEMGELFKAIALTKNYNHPLLGFTETNHITRLSCPTTRSN